MRPRHSLVWSTILPSASCNFSFYFSVVDDGPYRFSGAGSPGCKLLAGSLEQVPLAGSLSLKGRQAKFYKYQSGRRRTANSEASPNQKPRRTALCSPVKGVQNHMVLARFCLLLPRGKSRRGVRGCVSPGPPKRNNLPCAAQRRREPLTEQRHQHTGGDGGTNHASDVGSHSVH